MTIIIERCQGLIGDVQIPGDKAISHRVVLFGALAKGLTTAQNWLKSRATMSTLSCANQLGIAFDIRTNGGETISVYGAGLSQMQPPSLPLNCNRSATTMRLLMGLLAGQSFDSTVTGDSVLNARPMERIARPLRLMGSRIDTTDGGGPVHIYGGQKLHPIAYTAPVASAHLHTAIVLAGLFTSGRTVVHQPGLARDHTVRLLQAMGSDIGLNGNDVWLNSSGRDLRPINLTVPGDFSAAAYWIVAATLVPDSRIRLLGVGLNPARTGLITALLNMGADISIETQWEEAGEPVGNLLVQHAELTGTVVEGQTSLFMIDDLPVFALAAVFAKGKTIVKDASEMRVKDSDRILAVVRQLGKMGAEIIEREDGFEISGPQKLSGAIVASESDHRIALSVSVGALLAHGKTTLLDPEELDESYPGFFATLESLGGRVTSENT